MVLDWLSLTGITNRECRARSDCTYVQSDLALHSLQNNFIIVNSRTDVKQRTALLHLKKNQRRRIYVDTISKSYHVRLIFQKMHYPTVIRNLLVWFRSRLILYSPRGSTKGLVLPFRSSSPQNTGLSTYTVQSIHHL